jgi:hypothetical protein
VVWIEPGTVYQGTLYAWLLLPIGTDWNDYYAFEAEAGDTVHAKVRGLVGCFEFVDPAGERVGAVRCTLAGWDALFPDGDRVMTGINTEVVLPSSGTHYLRFNSFGPQHYAFAFAFDQEAPEPGLLGEPLPPLPPM